MPTLRIDDDLWVHLTALGEAGGTSATKAAVKLLWAGVRQDAPAQPPTAPVRSPDAPISHTPSLPAVRPAKPAQQVQERPVRIRGFSALTGEALIDPPTVDIRARNKPKRGG